MSFNEEIASLVETLPTIIIPELDIKSILMEDKIRSDSAFRIGKLIDVDIDVLKQGEKYEINDESVIYLLKLKVPNAHSVELLFNPFYIPKDGRLFVFKPDRSDFAGAYTSESNTDNNSFSTRAIIGEEVIIEYQTTGYNTLPQELIIDYVCHNFRDFYRLTDEKSLEETDCFYNVHCRSLHNLSRSVIKWTYYEGGYNFACSCALINQDVPVDELKYYVITANHCGKDAELSTAKFYFNYSQPSCNTGSGSVRYATEGASKKANNLFHDMFLMELIEKPLPDYDVFLPGWNREDYEDLYPWVIGIHHPYGWVKKLSEGDLGMNINPYFWRVSYNDYPVASGSSGSPLFEDDGYQRIIGWESYSYCDCDHPDDIVAYGKLNGAWTGVTSGDRLRDWLDPYEYDEMNIEGRDPCFEAVTISNRELRSAQYLYQPWNKVIVQAGSEINALNDVTVIYGAEFEFHAGDKIKLLPGFHVQNGASFSAIIEPCAQNKYGPFLKNFNIDYHDIVLQSDEPQYVHEQFIIYPNPISDYLNIDCISEGESEISLYNSIGVLSYRSSENCMSKNKIEHFVYDVSNLSYGIYFYKFRTGLKIYTGKILKQ